MNLGPLTIHTLTSTPASRTGRTAHWPASTGWVRYAHHIRGIIARIGNRSVYVAVLPRTNVRPIR